MSGYVVITGFCVILLKLGYSLLNFNLRYIDLNVCMPSLDSDSDADSDSDHHDM